MDFERNWAAYVGGFGNASAEHWLGLENLHYLTSGRNSQRLRVDIWDCQRNQRFIIYQAFMVSKGTEGEGRKEGSRL